MEYYSSIKHIERIVWGRRGRRLLCRLLGVSKGIEGISWLMSLTKAWRTLHLLLGRAGTEGIERVLSSWLRVTWCRSTLRASSRFEKIREHCILRVRFLLLLSVLCLRLRLLINCTCSSCIVLSHHILHHHHHLLHLLKHCHLLSVLLLAWDLISHHSRHHLLHLK